MMTTPELLSLRNTIRLALERLQEHLVDVAAERQRVEIARQRAALIENRVFLPANGRCSPQNNPNATVVQHYPKGRWT